MSFAAGPGSGADYPDWVMAMAPGPRAVMLAPGYMRPDIIEAAKKAAAKL